MLTLKRCLENSPVSAVRIYFTHLLLHSCHKSLLRGPPI